MGLENVVTKEYMRENTVFADAFNYLIYDGERFLIRKNYMKWMQQSLQF